CLAAASVGLSAPANPLPVDLPEIGPHHRLVHTASGGYVAVAGGMHYLDQGEWKLSDPTIGLQPGGAAALRLPQKILFGQSLAAGVSMLTPAGQHVVAIPRAIAYVDRLGRSVVLGTLRNPPTRAGELHPGNVLVFPDCYDGIRAGVRYVVDRGSIIQM